MTAIPPMTQGGRAELIARHEALLDRYIQAVEADAGYDEERALYLQTEDLLEAYFASLPRPPMARCPFCQAPFHHSFDPWGVDGYWWQEGSAKTVVEPAPCPHLGVLQGAVDLGGITVHGGREDASLGPGVPFVIPRVLDQPSVVAVIRSLPMTGGLEAYPITYFAGEVLPPGSFTHPWTRSTYGYPDGRGGVAWRVDTDPWDFDLAPWVEKGKILWIEGGDADLRLRSVSHGPCPYVDLEGVRGRQFVRGDEVWVMDPPQGEGVDPFGA